MARLFEPTRRFPLSDIDDQGAHQRCWTWVYIPSKISLWT
jgi:hypothetical protein